MAESEEELKSLLMKVKEESEKSWLKTQHSENKDHGTRSHHVMANRWGNNGNCERPYFWGLQKHFRWWLQTWNKRHSFLGRKVMTNLDSILKNRDITLPTKVCLVKAMVFPGVMYGCKSWTIKKAERQKNWCFWTVVLEKTLESPLDCKEIQPVHPGGNQSWIFIGRTDAEAETPIICPPDAKSP